MVKYNISLIPKMAFDILKRNCEEEGIKIEGKEIVAKTPEEIRKVMEKQNLYFSYSLVTKK